MMVTILVLFACGTSEPPAPPSPSPAEAPAQSQVEVAARIANAIDAAPADADAILSKHGMTEEAYRTLLYEIAEDSTKSAAFLAARQ